MKVVVTGGTGFIGRKLVAALTARGDEVVLFARDPERALAKAGRGVSAERWDTAMAEGPWERALRGAGAVVHLAGEPINGRRWDEAYKQRIRSTRTEGTSNLVRAIGRVPSSERPAVLASASGVDYYGETGDREATEQSPAGATFLAGVCVAWEREALAAREHGLRVSCLRTGIVLGDDGGALEKMALPFKLFVGGPVGGRQWFPWLHAEDMVSMYVSAVSDPRFDQPFNALTESVRMEDFAKALGRALHRRSWAPVPGFAVKLAMGELGALVLESKRAAPAFLRSVGFSWRFAALDDALRSALGR